MVVFTCNICGESLQKPKVEKHYSFNCRNAQKSLTCVDCFKDFKGEEYATHVKCITEQERYAAKGSFTKPVVKKGDVKQESWTEIIKSVIESNSNVKANERQIFTIMSNAANVPRKKIKFVNFVKSASGNKASNKDIEEVWDIIEKYKASTGQQENGTSDDTNAENENANKSAESTENNEDKIVEEPPKKKKKKSKNAEERSVENGINGSETSINEAVTENKKKLKTKNADKNKSAMSIVECVESANKDSTEKSKKKKKSKIENTNEDPISEQPEIVTNGNVKDGSKKTKRKSKTTSEALTEENTENEVSKKKKRKTEDLVCTENTNLENVEAQGSTESGTEVSKKKKKRKAENSVENINSPNGDSQETVENDVEVSKKKKTKTENGVTQLVNEDSKKRKLKNNSVENGVSEDKKRKDEPNPKENGTQDSDNSPCGFCFKEKILEVVTGKKNISLEKLEKKVLSLYHSLIGIEPTAKVSRKFKKHLKRISNIEVVDNNVRLVNN